MTKTIRDGPENSSSVISKYEIDDYEVCRNCGHIGILHQYKYGKCGATTGHIDNALYCGCEVKRDLSL